jgi:hypothetical protein
VGDYCICELAMVDGTLKYQQIYPCFVVVILGDGRCCEIIDLN